MLSRIASHVRHPHGAGNEDVELPPRRPRADPATNLQGLKTAVSPEQTVVWTVHVEKMMYLVARKFGFQTFNRGGKASEPDDQVAWVPATAFLAADHLCHLLITDALPREVKGGETDNLELAMGKAVWRLHATVFQSYDQWSFQVRVDPFPKASIKETWAAQLGDAKSTNAALRDLCLYFGLWTEAANLKHTPELMWFLFWCMRNSLNFAQLEVHDPPSPWKLSAAALDDLKCLRQRRIDVRNKYKAIIAGTGGYDAAVVQGFQECPGNEDRQTRMPNTNFDDIICLNGKPGRLKRMSQALDDVTGLRQGFTPDIEVLVEMVALRDGGTFTERIVQPIFVCLAMEVDLKGGSGKEIALRLGYDDVNESFTDVGNVRVILQDILQSSEGARPATGADMQAAFATLWTLGGVAPWQESMATKRYIGGGKSAETGQFVCKGWLRKTYQERRTWFALFRAFFRVIAFHILLFHFYLALAFSTEKDAFEGGRWWVPVSTIIITHAILQAIYSYGGSFQQAHVGKPPAANDTRLQVAKHSLVSMLCCCFACIPGVTRTKRNPTDFEKQEHKVDVDKRDDREWSVRHLNSAPSLVRRLVEMLCWIVAVVGLLVMFLGQFAASESEDEFFNRDFFREYWGFVAAVYIAIMVIHWGPLTARDGYVQGAHSLRAGAATGWTHLIRCCSGFDSCFARTVQGEPFLFNKPSVGLRQTLLNVLFWCLVFAMKFPFDYFLMIKPLAKPIKALLREGWLSIDEGDIGGTDIPYPDGDWILVGALAFPALIMVMVDTGVFYQLAVFVFGCSNGLFHLNLGQITNWQDVIREFDHGVKLLFNKVISETAQERMGDDAVANVYFDRMVPGTARARMVYDSQPERQRDSIHIEAANKQLGPVMAFSFLWDKIVLYMRESDIINNKERELLRFTKLPLLAKYGIRPLTLPGCFYAGKLQSVIDAGLAPSKAHSTVLREMWSMLLVLLRQLEFLPHGTMSTLAQVNILPITESQYHLEQRSLLIKSLKEFIGAVRDLGKMPRDADGRAKAKKGIVKLFVSLGRSFEIEIAIYQAARGLEQQAAINFIKAVVSTLKTFPAPPDGVAEDVEHTQRLDAALDTLYKGGGGINDVTGIDEATDCKIMLDVLTQALTLTEAEAQPRSLEACRTIRFFMSSLLSPHLETPRPVEEMLSLTTLVPHYAEDVLYPLDRAEITKKTKVEAKIGDTTNLSDAMAGYEITTAEYLRIVFADDWDSFVERMQEKYNFKADAKNLTERDWDEGGVLGSFTLPDSDEPDMERREGARLDLMMWASKRGQLLSRTVHGMMLYERALRDLIELEHPGQDMDAPAVQHLLEAKFRHIVSSQVYGKMKASNKAGDRWNAYATEKLMEQFPSFRVAYMDNVDAIAPGAPYTQYSVLLRHNPEGGDGGTGAVEEVYRVRLPKQGVTKRGVVLGEGKPENQNHAAVFCFGECVQTVDMNQDGTLAEAYKMRNLLGEFGKNKWPLQARPDESAYSFRQRLETQASRTAPIALVGFREWIFSGSASALGSFAAGAEFAFGTIVQRTMGNPGGVRFHYGHPDVWNKLFTMTRGGVSKSTRAFHVSEDVFGGYNAVFRGATIKYREYLAVGKGRDVGFEQINGFEAKVAGGNGEQSISRDAYRLGSRLDWFRLMSWYHSGIGFFMNTTLLMASVYLSVFVLFLFALADTTRLQSPDGDDEDAIIPTINSIQVVQLGFLSLIPYWGELCLESGFVAGSFDILRQLVAGAVGFFIFRQQTSAHAFVQDVYYGGATYIATGRGFALTHSSYIKLFTAFGRSHMYLGYQFVLMVFTLAFLDIQSYLLSTWGVWLVAFSLFFSPFWFNPLSFDYRTVRLDWINWRQWMAGDTDPATKTSWLAWHRDNMAKPRNVTGKQTDHHWNRMAGILMQTFNVVMVIATFERLNDPRTVQVPRLDDANGDGIVDDVILDEFGQPELITIEVDEWSKGGIRAKQLGIVLYEVLVVCLCIGLLSSATYRGLKSKRTARVLGFGISLLFLFIFIVYCVYFAASGSEGFAEFVLLAFANYTALVVIVQLLLYGFPHNATAQTIVDTGYYAADTIVGYLTFGFLFLLSLVPIIDNIQATLLFNYDFVREARTGQQLKELVSKQARVHEGVDTKARLKLMKQQAQSAALARNLPPIPHSGPLAPAGRPPAARSGAAATFAPRASPSATAGPSTPSPVRQRMDAGPARRVQTSPRPHVVSDALAPQRTGDSQPAEMPVDSAGLSSRLDDLYSASKHQ